MVLDYGSKFVLLNVSCNSVSVDPFIIVPQTKYSRISIPLEPFLRLQVNPYRQRSQLSPLRNRSFCRWMNRSLCRWMNRSLCRWMNRSLCQWMNRSSAIQVLRFPGVDVSDHFHVAGWPTINSTLLHYLVPTLPISTCRSTSPTPTSPPPL